MEDTNQKILVYIFNLSKPQFPHLQYEHAKAYILELLW